MVVIDRGMASDENVEELTDAGYDVIVGVRQSEGSFGELVESITDDEIERTANNVHCTDRVLCAVERVKATTNRGAGRKKKKKRRQVKFVVYQDPKLRGDEKAGLWQALADRQEKLRELEREMASSCGKRREQKTKRGRRPDWAERVRSLLKGMEDFFSWNIKEEGGQVRLTWRMKGEEVEKAVARLARCVIMTTAIAIPKEELVRAYLDKDEVEKVWRLGKGGGLGLQGIKHYRRDRVQAYLLVCYLAYLLWVVVRRRLKDARINISPEKALNHLRRIEIVRFRLAEREVYETPKPVGVEGRIQKAFGLQRLLPVALN